MEKRSAAIADSSLRRSIFLGGPVLVYAALIYFFSSLSAFPDTVSFKFGFDKFAHFIEYYFLGCLLYRWFSAGTRIRNGWRVHGMVILIGACYALSDEWHQSFVPGRDASLWDVLFDSLGVGTGAVTYPLIRRKILSVRAVSGKGERIE